MVKTMGELLHGVHENGEGLPPLSRAEGFRRAPKGRCGGGEQTALFD
jgi:hypothetical protein